MKIFSKLVLFIIFLIPLNVFAQNQSEGIDNESALQGRVIANVMSDNNTVARAVVVDKFLKKLYNVQVQGDNFTVINELPVIYGGQLGDKKTKGDLKTPEGVYFTTAYMSSKYLLRYYGKFAQIYGDGAFPLNYPNPIDSVYNKTGSGIWLHGVKPNTEKISTKGCVALHNKYFDILRDNISVKYPVIIADNLTYVTPDNYSIMKNEILGRFNAFMNSWKTSDYQTFKTFVHEKFRSKTAHTAQRYLGSKEYLMKVFPKRVVDTKSIKVYMENKDYVVFDTEQFYCAPNIANFGSKKYYFLKAADGKLKLISEEFIPKDVTPIINQGVDEFVNGWVEAWRSQNIDDYMNYYSQSFKTDRFRKYSSWRRYKKRLFDKNKQISVEVSNISWKKTGRGFAVSFVQNYHGDRVKDKGIKILYLSGCPTQFKIISESWRPL